jgi:NRPS condensation-like uncharacterized protein
MYRQLGTEERIVWSYSQLRPIHFVLSAHIIGSLHHAGLQQALSQVQQRHPLLNVKLTLDRDEIPWFINAAAPIPVRLVERHSEQQWQQEVERELANPLDWNQAPLIRVVLLQGQDASDLIITCDHTIADGRSVVFLLQDILRSMSCPDRPLAALSQHPPYEQLTPKFEQKIPAPSFKPSLATAKTKPSIPNNSLPRLQAWSLSIAETTALVSACKEAAITVHHMICAAFLLAIRHTQDRDWAEAIPLKCLSPIDIRRFLPALAENVGAYFTYHLVIDQVDSDSSLWELARSIKTQLDQKINPEQIFADLPDSETFMSTQPSPTDVIAATEAAIHHDLNVSNLGRLEIAQQYGEIQLTSVYAPSAICHIENALFVGVATLGDRMFFNLVYSESDFSAAQIKQLQQTAMQFLN